MRFRSAKEDLCQTTLAALRSQLERMEYLAGLRQGQAGEQYDHWGFTRVHGEAPAQAALRQAHGDALDALLRMPLQQLYAEGEQQPGGFERGSVELLPPATDALRAAHFSLVWDAMATVARRRASHRPAA